MAMSGVTPLPLGAIVKDRYRVVAVVGHGGLGTVYQVTDIFFGKGNVYALKEMADASPGARKQFANEAGWLEGLDHNHIPRYREFFEADHKLYLVMDFVEGENLEQKLARNGGRPLPEGQVLAWIYPICDALRYLHGRMPPILHRDVKPANIIVTPNGHPVLVDLGIAKEHLPGAGQTATFVRKAGTEGYAPPEQYTAAGKTGPWSDVYGLGATLYQLVTGCLPATAVERIALDVRLIRPRELNPNLSPMVEAAILRALAIRPTDRFQSVGELVAAMRAVPDVAPSGVLRPLGGQQPLSLTPVPPPDRMPAAPLTLPRVPAQPSRPPRTPAVPSPAPSAPSSPGSRADLSRPNLGSNPMLSKASGTAPSLGWSAAPSQPELPQELPPPDAPARGKRPWFVITIALLVLAVIGLGVAAVFVVPSLAPPDRSSPRVVVAGYYDALKQHDYDRAWQYLATNRDSSASQGSFTSAATSDDARLGTVLGVTITRTDSDATGHVTVLVEVRRSQAADKPLPYTLSLSQYSNTWLIDSIAAR